MKPTGSTITFLPLTLAMSKEIYLACYGNVATYFHNFTSFEDAESWVKRALDEIAQGEKVEFAVYLDTVFAGLVSLRDLKTDTPEFGLWIDPDFQGKGIGKESLLWLIQWAKTHTKAKQLVYETESNNAASKALAKSCKFIFEKQYAEGEIIFVRYTLDLER